MYARRVYHFVVLDHYQKQLVQRGAPSSENNALKFIKTFELLLFTTVYYNSLNEKATNMLKIPNKSNWNKSNLIILSYNSAVTTLKSAGKSSGVQQKLPKLKLLKKLHG